LCLSALILRNLFPDLHNLQNWLKTTILAALTRCFARELVDVQGADFFFGARQVHIPVDVNNQSELM